MYIPGEPTTVTKFFNILVVKVALVNQYRYKSQTINKEKTYAIADLGISILEPTS